jgi:cytochrome P450
MFVVFLQVTMILHEVIRLYPSGIFLQRTTRKEIELGGIKYPEGANFTLPVPSIHHDPSIWGDASEFNLERFANGVSKATKFKTAFFMFGWGFLDLPWTELCNAGSQDDARHHAPELLL